MPSCSKSCRKVKHLVACLSLLREIYEGCHVASSEMHERIYKVFLSGGGGEGLREQSLTEKQRQNVLLRELCEDAIPLIEHETHRYGLTKCGEYCSACIVQKRLEAIK